MSKDKKNKTIDKAKLFSSITTRIDTILASDEINANEVRKELTPVANDLIIYQILDNKDNNKFNQVNKVVDNFLKMRATSQLITFVKMSAITLVLVAITFYIK